MNDDVLGVSSPTPVFTSPHYFQTQQILNTTPPANQMNVTSRSISMENKSSLDESAGNKVAGFDASDIVKQLERGHRPIIIRQFSGKPRILFLPKPKAPKPTIAIVLHYKTCSYLGNYGAGKTLKSFSLLPGEKTTISIKTYKQTEESKKRADNILDSFSESSADDLQTYIEEMSTKDQSLDQQLILAIKTYADLTLQLTPKNNLSVGASADFTSTLNTHIASHNEQLSSALANHVSKSSHERSVSVNTESSFTQKTGEEDSTIRQVQNINLSRVLNFIFRQLNQEYFSVTYLDDVSFIYSNGYPESNIEVGLSNINELLTQVLLDGAAGSPCFDITNKVRNDIFAKLCSIKDYLGNTVPFLECFTETVASCCSFTDPPISYTNKIIRKRAGLVETYRGIDFPGIITKVQNHILPTEAVIVEALLGQGEALDCYNMKLQDAATVAAGLENDAEYQRIQIINGIAAANDKATFYKKVFGPCCDVAQNTNNCGCSGECSCGK